MPPTPSPADIRAFVQAASRIWARRLIDYSRSNSLLFYRDLKVGTFDLTPYKGVLEKLLAGDALTAEQIVGMRSRQQHRDPVARQRAEEELRQKIRTVFVALRRKALGNLEEKGIQTLHLAVGMASWPAADGGRPYAAPILLIPASIDARGRAGSDLRLSATGEPRLNPVLLSVLAEVHDVRVDAVAVLKESGEEDEAGQWGIEPEKVFAAIRARAASVGQFAIESRCIVANFQFAKMAMVEDLKKNEEAMASSPFIAAIAGHSASRQQLSQAGVEVEPRQLDEMPSNKDFLVLDADSTQQRAIVAVGKGLNCVVQGPPGTGKSQSIANLIAQSVAEGRRVLFVAEKRAALDAVVKRLTHPDVDLGHLILDLHGASVSRKDVMANLSRTLDTIRQSLPVEGAENVYREFDARRRKLNEHARAVNADRAPLGLSMNRVIGRLLRLPKEAASELRFRGDTFARLTHERAEDIKRLLRECAAHRALLLGEDTSPWGTAKVADGRTAQIAVDLAAKLARDLLPVTDKLVTEWTRSAQVAKPSGIEAALRLGKCIVDTDRFRQKFRSELFSSDPGRLAASLSPATKGAASALWAWLTDGKYREARRKMRSLATTEASARELQAGAQQAAELAALWRKVRPAGGVPDTNTAKKLLSALQNVTAALKEFRALTGLDVAKGLTFADSQSRLGSLAADQRTPYQIASVSDLRQQIREHGLEPLLQELRSQKVPESLWQQRFEYVWLYSALDNILASEQSLAVFSGRTHECLIEEFRRLDRDDRFFVKNLETVQGDEREAIILTIGYGKAANGDLPHRFGPLTHEAGHRRLNVAVTRAKRRMTVVSSFAHHEVDLARSGSRGVQLLKAYLEYAASGGSRLTQAEVAGEVPLNPFEADIRDALEAAGIHTRPQFGASRYRIDLVAMHPEKKGRPVLAIECDGATYHSSATARDRDRLRQMHLQRLGWRFHRIWSTDWFFSREAEMARLIAAFGEAVSRADEADAGQQEEMCQEELSDAMVPQQAAAVVQPSRGPRPSIRRRDSIDGYTNTELRQLADWIASDGLLRTDDEFVRCMLEELPFNRLGARIRERLEEVVRQRGRVRQPR